MVLLRLLPIIVLLWSASSFAEEQTKFSTDMRESGVVIRINGQLFTEYLIRSGTKPVLWPIIGPTGKAMTRAFPITDQPQPHEEDDHRHHRSFWFTQEGINGVNFWMEPPPGKPLDGHIGETVHREFVSVSASDATAAVITRNDWMSAAGEKICEDLRTIRFGANPEQRWIDFQIELTASEGPLEIADSKEGTFGVRVAGTMKVEAGLGGRIINSRGQTDADAWGMPAEWVDYHGPVDGQQVGIAIFSHPSNFRPVPRWHVRLYGLFTANPFGEEPFPRLDDYRQGPVRIDEGDSLKLRYLVLLHLGDEQIGKVAEAFEQFAAN